VSEDRILMITRIEVRLCEFSARAGYIAGPAAHDTYT